MPQTFRFDMEIEPSSDGDAVRVQATLHGDAQRIEAIMNAVLQGLAEADYDWSASGIYEEGAP